MYCNLTVGLVSPIELEMVRVQLGSLCLLSENMVLPTAPNTETETLYRVVFGDLNTFSEGISSTSVWVDCSEIASTSKQVVPSPQWLSVWEDAKCPRKNADWWCWHRDMMDNPWVWWWSQVISFSTSFFWHMENRPWCRLYVSLAKLGVCHIVELIKSESPGGRQDLFSRDSSGMIDGLLGESSLQMDWLN